MNNKPFHYLLPVKPTGFTLAEVVVATAIVATAISVVVTLIIEGTRVQTFLNDQATAVQTADKALLRMTTALRETSDSDDGNYALSEASGTTLIFYANVDDDSATEKISYSITATDVVEVVTQPTDPPVQYLAENATSSIIAQSIVTVSEYASAVFSYYDSNYPTDTVTNPLIEPIDLSSVTLVKIHLDVNVNPKRIPDTNTVETFVQLRNLNTNL